MVERESLETDALPDTPVRWGGEATVRTEWIVAGVGALVFVIGGVVYMTSNQQFGVILILGGLVVGVVGVGMRLAMGIWGDKLK